MNLVDKLPEQGAQVQTVSKSLHVVLINLEQEAGVFESFAIT